MPETAAHRRLDNPFDPAQAIPASARLLRDHYRKYGNLGLAAAAYNAGPRRVDEWRAKKGPMPQETQDYVKTITGFPVESWTMPLAGGPAVKVPQGAPCQEAAGLLAWDGPDEIPMPVASPRVVEAKAAAAAAREAAKAKKTAKAADKKKQETKQETKQDTKQDGTKKPDAKAQDLKQGAKDEGAKKPDVKEPDKKEPGKKEQGTTDNGAAAAQAAQGVQGTRSADDVARR
jgi:hypothetical protein